jgi:carboxyl-terminal processing protease
MSKLFKYLSLYVFFFFSFASFNFLQSEKNSPQASILDRWRKSSTKKKQKKGKVAEIESKESDESMLDNKDIYQWLQTYAEVVGLVEDRGFRKVEFKKFIQESLKSAVAQVDAHSAFFTPEAYKAALESTSGEFSGIGVSIISKAPEDEVLVIVDVIQGGPADKAGIKGGDKIIEINEEKLKNLSTDEVVSKLKGKAGSSVNIKVIRNKKPFDFSVMRDIVKDQASICYQFRQQKAYYLSLKIFNETAAKQMSGLLKKANDGECKGIVLDLRKNPGGTLDSAIDMAGLFLEKGTEVVTTKDNLKKTIRSYRTRNNPLLKSSVPIFVLVDNFTASAAEILAGCLQYHSIKSFEKKAKNSALQVFLVGDTTFGKGSVQELMPIKNGCALKLTTMLYYLPESKSIQAVGIQPDFIIKPKMVPADELKWIQEFYGRESALKHYITVEEVENNGGKVEKAQTSKKISKKKNDNKKGASGIKDDDKEDTRSVEEKFKEDLALDVQVQASINMITLLDMAKRCSPDLVKSRDLALKFLKQNYLTDEGVTIEKVE